ncbi:MAG: formylglycine-generating enzyme family protein [Ketobacteraceae bacterium]|nr:formylglycine-generating enzyme family protein [Ketobacteraceae bacterium]
MIKVPGKHLLVLIMGFALYGCNLTVEIKDNVGGSVTSKDGNIVCPEQQCSYNYSGRSTRVELTATASEGYEFYQFSNAAQLCENGAETANQTGICEILSDSNKTLTVEFRPAGSLVGNMVFIPGGFFMMGNTDQVVYEDELPVHEVFVSPFFMGETEVTWTQYQYCIDAGACEDEDDQGWGRGDQPVVGVGFQEARNYIEWLNAQTGENYRLPSEAEWEYAARAGTTTTYWFGDCITSEDANYAAADMSNNGDVYSCSGAPDPEAGKPLPVKSYAPNGFGLYDMVGNVTEWTRDCVNFTYEGAPVDGSPWLAGLCPWNIQRGGNFRSGADGVRSAARGFIGLAGAPGEVTDGFRLARD